jgi:hypothetical protein
VRYYGYYTFTYTNGSDSFEGEEDMPFSSLAEARTHGLRKAEELMSSATRGGDDWPGWFIAIVDDLGVEASEPFPACERP